VAPRARGSLRPLLVALVFAAFSSGCDRGSDITVPRGEAVEENLARARASPRPLYYAGRSFSGLALTQVDVRGHTAYFAYGTCVIPARTEGGCAVPVQIQMFPFNASQWRRAAGCERRPSLLGVPAARHDGLVLFTGRTVVKIYARSPAEDRRVALSLRRVSDDKPVERLPRPERSVDDLQLRACR